MMHCSIMRILEALLLFVVTAVAEILGVYIAVALVWLWRADGVPLTRWDLAGAAVSLIGMVIIVWGGYRP